MDVISFAVGFILGVSVIGLITLLQFLAYVHPRFYFGKRAYYKHLIALKRLRDEIGKEHANEFND